jgi:hypothetical protein
MMVMKKKVVVDVGFMKEKKGGSVLVFREKVVVCYGGEGIDC